MQLNVLTVSSLPAFSWRACESIPKPRRLRLRWQPKVLRDFARLNLDPWAAQQVTFNLSRYDLSIWDVIRQKWVIPDGDFQVIVGRDSMDDALKASLNPKELQGWQGRWQRWFGH